MTRSSSALLASTVAALALAVPAVAAGLSGTYRGDTSQNRTVNAVVKSGTIKSLSFSVYLLCGPGGSKGSSSDVLFVKNVKVKSSGAFTVKSVGDSTNGLATYVLKGKVTKGKVTGSIEQFFRNGCQTFELTFSAKRR